MSTVTAQVVVKNGSLTVKNSILSIIDVVDYIYVVDHGSNDETVRVVEDLMMANKNIKLFNGAKLSYAECRNLVISMAPTKYILKWDADFVALREKFGASIDFGGILSSAIDEMEDKDLNLCPLLAYNIGFTYDCIDKTREIEGVHGDIRLYKRIDFIYKTGEKYADEFVPKVAPRRLYLNKLGAEQSPIAMLHFNQLKDLYSFGLRDQFFEYDRLKAMGEIQVSFEEWLLSSKGIVSVAKYISSKVRRMSEKFIFSEKFKDLYEKQFYKEIFNQTPFSVEFDSKGNVVDVYIKS